MEQQFREERKAAGKSVMGPKKLAQLDHRDRPQRPAVRTRKPLCHAATKEAADEYEAGLREFLDQYWKASDLWRRGFYDVVFPKGTFKPPDIRAAV